MVRVKTVRRTAF